MFFIVSTMSFAAAAVVVAASLLPVPCPAATVPGRALRARPRAAALRAAAPEAAPDADRQTEGREEGGEESLPPPSNSRRLEVLVWSSPSGGVEWAAVGCNATQMAMWLSHSAGAGVVSPSAIRTTALTLGNRTAHRWLLGRWRDSRLLLRGARLRDVEYRGRWHAEALAARAPARSRRMIERLFRQEVAAYARRLRGLRAAVQCDGDALVDYFRSQSGVDVDRLSARRGGGSQDLDDWRALLSFFRDHFPYDRGEPLGCVLASAAEAAHDAQRTELQACDDGRVQRFPRYNSPAKIVETRRGRCGEYSQLLYALVAALAGRAASCGLERPHAGGSLPRRRRRGRGDAVATLAWRRRRCAARPLAAAAAGGYTLDPKEAAVDLRHLYSQDWGKTLNGVLAFTDGAPTVDVTRAYSTDWDATLAAREVSPRCLRQALQAAAGRRGA